METKRFFESEYIDVESVKNAENKTATILNAGIPEMTKFGERFTLMTDFNRNTRKYVPNKISWENISKKWGTISDNWVGRTIKFEVEYDEKNKRDRVVAYPTEITPQTEDVTEGV